MQICLSLSLTEVINTAICVCRKHLGIPYPAQLGPLNLVQLTMWIFLMCEPNPTLLEVPCQECSLSFPAEKQSPPRTEETDRTSLLYSEAERLAPSSLKEVFPRSTPLCTEAYFYFHYR